MLGIIPEALYGRVGAVFSALIVVFCLIGLTMHKDFYAHRRRRDFFCYYTNLSNLFVLLYFSVVAPRLYASRVLSPLIPHCEFILMMCIMLTFTVFHILLLPNVRRGVLRMPRTREFSILLTDNLIIHYIVPWLVLAYWLLCGPDKQALRLWDALLFPLIPLFYLIFIFLRAGKHGNLSGENSPYPYPFLDSRTRGVRHVMRTCIILFTACVAGAVCVLLLLRVAFSCGGGGHALILI